MPMFRRMTRILTALFLLAAGHASQTEGPYARHATSATPATSRTVRTVASASATGAGLAEVLTTAPAPRAPNAGPVEAPTTAPAPRIDASPHAAAAAASPRSSSPQMIPVASDIPVGPSWTYHMGLPQASKKA
jgi:hypothetical protein